MFSKTFGWPAARLVAILDILGGKPVIDIMVGVVQLQPSAHMTDYADSPGVRFPPPLLYVIPILGGCLLDRRWPLRIPSFRGVDILRLVLIAAWLLLVVASMLRFRSLGTSVLPFRPATTLVLSGAYRFTRNPMYLGFAPLTIAIGLMWSSWWPVLLLFPTLYLVQTLVILPEERYLRRRFGAEYEAYTRRVRRWL